jgi:outer membrane protein assembly factor BamB
MRVSTVLRAAVACAFSSFATAAAAADWLQWGYDPQHSGNNPDEATITADNVASLTRRYDIPLSADTNAAPVLARAVPTEAGTKDLLFVTSRNGRITAFDASNGSVLWSKDTSGTPPTESSPAIDPNRQFVYSYGIDGKVHKYQIADGTEITTGGWPQIATLKPSVEKGASAISFALTRGTTYLYAVNNGYIGDGGDYQGHITTIDLSTNEQKVFNTLCSDITIHMSPNACDERQSGIWGRPGAIYYAELDRIYVTTANGLFDAHLGGLNWGDSVLALNPDGTGMGGGFPLDSYTPKTFQQLDSQDIDLGSASLTILKAPEGSVYPHIGVQTGKDSHLHLINLDDMSGTGAPGGVGGYIQDIQVPTYDFWMLTQTSTWVAPDGTPWVFIGNNAGISGLKVELDGSNRPFLQPTWQTTGSSTSTMVANDVLYHIGACSGGRCVYARNPLNGSVLWTSPTIGNIKWQSPIVVNGAVYVASNTRLNRFDLGTDPVTHDVTPSAGPNGRIFPETTQPVDEGATLALTLLPDRHYAVESVSGCGGTLDGNVYRTGPIDADCTVTATFVFVQTTHVVTPTADTGGSIEPDTPQTVDEDDTVSFTVTPDAHYEIAGVTGCGGQLDGDTYTTGPITADCTVSATFSLITHTVTPDAGDGTEGTIDPDTPQTVADGETASFTITPFSPPYFIASVTGCDGTLEDDVYTTGPVTADCTVTVTWGTDDTDPIFQDGFDGGAP